MIEAVRCKNVATVSARDGTAAVAIGVAAEWSIHLGRMVTLAEVMQGMPEEEVPDEEPEAKRGARDPRGSL